MMDRFGLMRGLMAAALVAGLATPAVAKPRHHPACHSHTGAIHISGGSAGFLVGGHWASGTLNYCGAAYPLKVGGLGVGEIGVSSFKADGVVSGLNSPHDIVGTYTAVEASATVGAGAGEIDMSNANGNGVGIKAHATSTGLKLTLAPAGMTIDLK